MKFRNKIIFIISYEDWGMMHMSKHHYAVELGRSGNEVYFINHPDKRRELERGEVKVLPTDFENVYFVKHRLFHPYFLKFKVNGLYNFLTSLHIRKIIRKVGKYPDVVWAFDVGNAIPIKYFSRSRLRIYMPVDGPFGTADEVRATEQADVIISVTPEILSTFKNLPIPKFQINHGVNEIFVCKEAEWEKREKIRVGYSGSLIRNDLDIPIFLEIITKHREIDFEFWGENDPYKSNIHLPQDVSKATLEFLAQLKKMPNVVMHGPVKAKDLAKGIQRMDALLICYNIKNDQNHHKVLEYLGTGKVIVSNFMSSYAGRRDLIEMVNDPTKNDDLPALFDRVITGLENYNSVEKQRKRIAFANEFTYASNVKRIEEFINTSVFEAH